MYMSWTLGALLIAISTVIIIAVIAFVVGVILAFVLVTPARIATDRSTREQRHEQENLEIELRDLRQKNSQLEAEHAGVVAERDHLRQQLAQMQSAQPAGPPRAIEGNSTDGHIDSAERPEAQPRHDEQPSLGDRLRGFFNRPQEDEQQQAPDNEVSPENQPPVPTA